jgi:uncharacterized protein (DUF58 family)
MAGSTYGALLDAVRGVRWPARRRVAGAVTGVHQSRARGTTAEFSEYRAYRQGDDPRRLNWKLLARSDRAYVRLATERAVLPTTIVVDASMSMAFPHPTLDKWRLTRELAVALAAVAHASGDPVGLIVAGMEGDLSRLAPRSRRGVVAEIARVLDAVRPRGGMPIAPAIAAARTPRIAILSDLLGDADAMLRASTIHLAAGGEVHVAHVIAEAELRPHGGVHLVRDPESVGEERLLAEETRAEYVERFEAWRREMARRWRAAGAAYSEAVTSEAASRIVRRLATPQTASA